MNQITPLAVDAYGRTMVEAFDERQIIGVPTGFQAFFGRPETGAKTLFNPNSAVVDIDIIRGSERLAAMIRRGGNARQISGKKSNTDGKFSTFSRLYPLIEEEGDMNADQLNRRMPGENPYQAMDKLDRLRLLALNIHTEKIRKIVRTFEFLCSQAVLTGKHPAIIGTANADLIYDFRRNASHIVTVGTGWNQVGAGIMADTDGICDKLRANGHVTADMMLLGSGAMDAFINNSDVQTQADNRRFELIEVGRGNPVPDRFKRFVDAGFTARGPAAHPQGL